ncbi:MAG TPA: cupin domain-containing protein [Ktedonobacterales bacterium]|nr:cupin domain-containing protein [Ktedonobacterales bacterium]
MNAPNEIADTTETGQLITFDLRELAHFNPDGPGVTVLADTGAARSVLFAFRAGQQLKEHQTSSQILVQVVRGRITFTAGGQAADARAGTLLLVEANAPHSITAQTDATVLVTMTPSPVHHSLQHEVFDRVLPLVTRADKKS